MVYPYLMAPKGAFLSFHGRFSSPSASLVIASPLPLPFSPSIFPAADSGIGETPSALPILPRSPNSGFSSPPSPPQFAELPPRENRAWVAISLRRNRVLRSPVFAFCVWILAEIGLFHLSVGGIFVGPMQSLRRLMGIPELDRPIPVS